jgi:hypothetical protein
MMQEVLQHASQDDNTARQHGNSKGKVDNAEPDRPVTQVADHTTRLSTPSFFVQHCVLFRHEILQIAYRGLSRDRG